MLLQEIEDDTDNMAIASHEVVQADTDMAISPEVLQAERPAAALEVSNADVGGVGLPAMASSSDSSQSLMVQAKRPPAPAPAGRMSSNSNDQGSRQARLKCPRCESTDTKFCYFNNYKTQQPRHFCKNCRRYWTKGGALRNVPIGGGCRKNKRMKHRTAFISSGAGASGTVLIGPTLMDAGLAPYTSLVSSPTELENGSGHLSLHMGSLSTTTAYHPGHLIGPSPPPVQLDIGSTYSMNRTIHGCVCVNICTCASSLTNHVDASAAAHLHAMPAGLSVDPPPAMNSKLHSCGCVNACTHTSSVNKQADIAGAPHSFTGHIPTGPIEPTFYHQADHHISSAGNLMMLTTMPLLASNDKQLSCISDTPPPLDVHAVANDSCCHGISFDPAPTQQSYAQQESTQIAQFGQDFYNTPAAIAQDIVQNKSLEQLQEEEEERTFMNEALKDMQRLLDAPDCELCQDADSIVHQEQKSAEEKLLVRSNDVHLLPPELLETTLPNGSLHKESWIELQWQAF